MKSKIISRLAKSIPLEIRVKVSINSFFLQKGGGCILVPVDKEGEPDSKLMQLNDKCFEEAKPLVEWVLKNIKEWKEEGCPE